MRQFFLASSKPPVKAAESPTFWADSPFRDVTFVASFMEAERLSGACPLYYAQQLAQMGATSPGRRKYGALLKKIVLLDYRRCRLRLRQEVES